jgi:hypothetical protein
LYPQSINISFDSQKLPQNCTRVKISNKVRLGFDRLKANQLKYGCVEYIAHPLAPQIVSE